MWDDARITVAVAVSGDFQESVPWRDDEHARRGVEKDGHVRQSRLFGSGDLHVG